MARPRKLTPVTEAAILDALRGGNTQAVAATAAGISPRQLTRWKQQYGRFRLAVEAAETAAQQHAVSRIRDAMGEHWQAAAWWLERRYPADWSKQVNLVLTLREEAVRLAREHGLDEAQALAEVEALLADGAR